MTNLSTQGYKSVRFYTLTLEHGQGVETHTKIEGPHTLEEINNGLDGRGSHSWLSPAGYERLLDGDVMHVGHPKNAIRLSVSCEERLVYTMPNVPQNLTDVRDQLFTISNWLRNNNHRQRATDIANVIALLG